MNDADVLPAGTVTEAGTESRALLVESETEEPPLGADPPRVTVHFVLIEGAKAEEAQVNPLNVVCVAGRVITPPDAESGIRLPSGVAAVRLVIPTEVLDAPWAMVRFTTATTPFATALAFEPDSKHLYAPITPTQLSVFPVLIAAGPAATDMLSTFADGYVNVH